ncbi:hypothetical protein [Sphingorhabdus sp.]|uniref:hypothetical protein n=1 Tax=Sphingorhabdus sp. TaxID=1902408 RepID=UPI00391CCE10
MTASAQRWNRILKVRSVQRQMVEVQLHRCENEVRNLVDLRNRISSIRKAAQPTAGEQNGIMLRSISELSSRLDSAQRALAATSQNAVEARDRQRRTLVSAKQREMAAEKLETTTASQEAKRAVDHQSRTAIFRKITKYERMI